MEKTETNRPICMCGEYWANTHFSVARYYVQISAFGAVYIIVNKDGKDIFECSYEAGLEGRIKAIEPGEPCDLCNKEFVKYYRKLGRDKFIQILKDNQRTGEKELHKIYRQAFNS